MKRGKVSVEVGSKICNC